MDELIRSHKAEPGTAVVNNAAEDGAEEIAWPWFIGLCGMLTIFLYRESLRFMLWARSLNY